MQDTDANAAGERRCSACGYRSANRPFFRQRPAGLVGRNAEFCLGCGPYAPTRRESVNLLLPPVLILGGVLLPIIDDGGEWAQFSFPLMFTGIFGLAHFLTVTVHELGHAAVAQLLGMRVLRITIGTGPLLARRRAGGCEVELRRFLTAGGTTRFYDRSANPEKWRRGLVLLGGAGANFVFATLVGLPLVLLPEQGLSDPLSFAYAILASQLLAAVANLIPRGAMIGQRKASSDGKLLVWLIKSRDHHRRALSDSWFWEGMPLLESGRHEEAWRYYDDAWRSLPGHVLLLAALVESAGKALGPRAALRCYFDHGRSLGPTDGEDRTATAAVLAIAAWNAVRAGDHDLLPMADQLSQQALQMVPELGNFQAIRGAVLLASQELEQGRGLMIEGVRKVEGKDDKAEFARFLAGVERMQGAVALADEWEGLADFLLQQHGGNRLELR